MLVSIGLLQRMDLRGLPQDRSAGITASSGSFHDVQGGAELAGKVAHDVVELA